MADGLEIDLAARSVRRDGEEVHLTPTEFELLRMLATNRGRLLTHRALLVEVWGVEYEDDTQVLRVHVANLRRKIEPPDGPRYIRTDPGVGYRFAARRVRRFVCGTNLCDLYEICIRSGGTSCGLDEVAAHSRRMDLVSIALALTPSPSSTRRSPPSTGWLMPQGWLQIVVFLVLLTALVPLLGSYLARVFQGERVFLSPLVGPLERFGYGCFACAPRRARTGRPTRARSLAFSLLSWLVLYLILRTQSIQPFNPEGFGSGPWNLSFNTTSSFVTNTNWQYYGGETTLSYFAQMAGLAVQNFLSAAVGIAVLAAVIRGFAARSASSLGNFWRDLIRITLYILLPSSFVAALVLVSQGVVQTLDGSQLVHTLTGGSQTLALGPVGSQEAIKLLGTNGGGFFNVNSAFPFENPNSFTNVVEIFLMLVDPRQPALRVRADGRQPAPGLGALRGDDGCVRRRRRGGLRRRAARQPGPAPAGVATHASTARSAATWRARRCATGSPPPRCGLR